MDLESCQMRGKLVPVTTRNHRDKNFIKTFFEASDVSKNDNPKISKREDEPQTQNDGNKPDARQLDTEQSPTKPQRTLAAVRAGSAGDARFGFRRCLFGCFRNRAAAWTASSA